MPSRNELLRYQLPQWNCDMRPPQTPRMKPPQPTVVMFCVLLFGTIGYSGCSSPNHFSARTLPPQLVAKKAENAQTLDLSKLATQYPSNELIGTGDVVEVTIAAGLGATEAVIFPTRIGEDGTANIPVVGPVELAGMELSDAEGAIASVAVSRGLYRQPHVTVTMKRRRLNRITVLGAVNKPGVVELPRDASDLLAAIVAAGNLSPTAGTHVEIRNPEKGAPSPTRNSDPIARVSGQTEMGKPNDINAGVGAKKTLQIDLVSAVKEGRGTEYRLEDGAVINVERHDYQPLQVIGLVTKPGKFDFPVGKDIHVLDAIAIAGGVSSKAANKIYVIRQRTDSSDPAVVTVSMQKAKSNGQENLLLQPGDVVSVEQTAATVMLDTITQVIRFTIGGSAAIF
ncbi:polysaccharide biosynthesis/export family protein [Planctopirus hydrillae]|uniref:Soluble ligand binding domain-containing protein n=1 Tax=Planctopirus hydrillae TaxID=1841610 RepID=A0A1C3E6P6_9PLAN|nr:polysaccharide biosynthesis/export family protein [Planctopirus hydrillae]ODA28883.1 hypothetical protein A6X21_10285 [Planctopirus hydrillae]